MGAPERFGQPVGSFLDQGQAALAAGRRGRSPARWRCIFWPRNEAGRRFPCPVSCRRDDKCVRRSHHARRHGSERPVTWHPALSRRRNPLFSSVSSSRSQTSSSCTRPPEWLGGLLALPPRSAPWPSASLFRLAGPASGWLAHVGHRSADLVFADRLRVWSAMAAVSYRATTSSTNRRTAGRRLVRNQK